MNQIEKMIWAGVYASGYAETLKNPPGEVLRLGNEAEWEAWEHDQLVNLVEQAACAITNLRELGPALLDGYDGHDAYKMWREVIAADTRVVKSRTQYRVVAVTPSGVHCVQIDNGHSSEFDFSLFAAEGDPLGFKEGHEFTYEEGYANDADGQRYHYGRVCKETEEC